MNTRRSTLAVSAVVVAAVAIVTYLNSVGNAFALDDNYIILMNPRVHQLQDQAAIWLTPYWPNFGEMLGLYRPLAIFGYAVQWSLGNGDPALFHSVSVALHATVSLLVLALLLRLVRPGSALFGALLFAVHPVHTEVVANVVGQAEMMSAAAVLAAAILYVDRPADEPGPVRTLAVALFYVIGMLAKEGAIVLPGLLVALDFATRRVRLERTSVRRYLRNSLRPLAVLGVAVGAYLTLRISVLGSIGGADAAPQLPFLRQGHRFLSALRAWPEYARLLFFPSDLSADYSPGVVLPVERISPMVLLGALLLIGTAGIALATPWMAGAGLGAAWFFITVFPVSNLVLPIGVLLAERILYLPSVGFVIVAAFFADHVVRRSTTRQLRFAVAAAVVVLAAGAARSWMRNPDWKDTNAVWDALVRDHPESYRAQWVNGWRMLEKNNRVLARGYFEIAYRIWPDDAVLLNNLAGVHIELGESEAAVPILERSRELSDALSQTESLLSYAYLAAGRFQESIDATIRADRLLADRASIMAVRAQAYEGLGRFQEAAGTWRFALRQPRGDTPRFWMMLARDLARVGLADDALQAADSAGSRIPGSAPLRPDLDRLVSSIRAGCFDPDSSGVPAVHPPAEPCDDPILEWPVVLPPNAQEVSNPLQNATQ